MASFGSGLVRTARTINLDKNRDERHSVDAATELLTQASMLQHLRSKFQSTPKGFASNPSTTCPP
jgi:hypothetical protein